LNPICYDVCGTDGFKAPEVLDNLEGYNGFISDVWSLGITLYTFINDGEFPWKISKIQDLDNATLEEELDLSETRASGDLGDLLKKMLERDPEQRILL